MPANSSALAKPVIEEATRLGMTVGTAESCTGGLVCAALTDVSGSSAAVRGGVVSYAVEVKRALLGVDHAVCSTAGLGVVSGICARQMSQGARLALQCDVAVSTTGIAGPTGAEPGKPVGTVWFAVSSVHGTHSVRRLLSGDRAEVRSQAVRVALSLLLEHFRFVDSRISN